MPRKPPAKRVFGLQAKSPSLFLSLYLNLFLSPPPLGGLRPPPARSRPPGIPPLRGHDPRRGNQMKPATKNTTGRHPNEKDGLQREGEATHNDGTPRGGAGQPGPRPPRERIAPTDPDSKDRLHKRRTKPAAIPATPPCTGSPGCSPPWCCRSGCSWSGARARRISADESRPGMVFTSRLRYK